MKPDVVFQHSCLISDACCLINLGASGQLERILEVIPVQVAVPWYIVEHEVKGYDLKPAIEAGLLRVVDPETEAEYETVTNYAAEFGADGEAYTGAIATHRHWAMATDENRVLNYMLRFAPHVQRLTTPELVKFWADATDIDNRIVRQTLAAITREGHYTIGEDHVCHPWWKSRFSRKTDDIA